MHQSDTVMHHALVVVQSVFGCAASLLGSSTEMSNWQEAIIAILLTRRVLGFCCTYLGCCHLSVEHVLL